MSSSFLATDTLAPHDLYLELLKVDEIPSSAFGGRPNIFAVVSLERILSAPQTVRCAVSGGGGTDAIPTAADGSALPPNPLLRTEAEDVTLSYSKFTVGSAAAVNAHLSSDTFPTGHVLIPSAIVPSSSHSDASSSSYAKRRAAGTIRVARSNIITNAPISANLETKLCVSHCHDREVLRITLYDHVESPRGFLGTAIVPIGGPLREYGARTVQLEGPTSLTMTITWEMADSTSAKGHHLAASFAAAMGSELDSIQRLGGGGGGANDPRLMETLKQRMEQQWYSRYGNSIQRVSAVELMKDRDAQLNGTAAASAKGKAAAKKLDDANKKDTTAPQQAAVDGDESVAPVAAVEGGATSPQNPPPPPPLAAAGGAVIISAREAHLEARVRELEDALLNVASNRDELVQRELLRRVAGGEVNVLGGGGGGAVGGLDAGGGGGGDADTLMALTVKDLTRIATNGHGTLTYALAQAAATAQLEAMGREGLSEGAVHALREARKREEEKGARPNSRGYHNPSLMAVEQHPASTDANASSPAESSAEGCSEGIQDKNVIGANTKQAAVPPPPSLLSLGSGEVQCPNLMDVVFNPSKPLSAEEDTLLKAYCGPRALYESDKTTLTTTHSAVFGHTINFPSLAPHHGHAMAASYVLGTDTITTGIHRGLPPLLATASVSNSMPLSYAKNSLKYKAHPMLDLLSTSSPQTPMSVSLLSPRSPAKRASAFPSTIGGIAANNTVLNDIAVASMYPTSAPFAASDPHYQDNTAAWRQALANRDTYMAVEGSKVTTPHAAA